MTRAEPDEWWQVTHLEDGISLIDEPHIQQFHRCNVWHVRGQDGDLLVDSILGVVLLRDRVPLVPERPFSANSAEIHCVSGAEVRS